jgi:hypothetical protein
MEIFFKNAQILVVADDKTGKQTRTIETGIIFISNDLITQISF